MATQKPKNPEMTTRLQVAAIAMGGAMADPYGRIKWKEAAAQAMKCAVELLKLEAEEIRKGRAR